MTLIFILQAQGGGLSTFLFPALIFVFIYFFFIRPQVKKQKEQVTFSSGLQKGDEIVTASGIIGQISKIEDDAVTVQIDPKTFIRVVPSAISKEMTDQYKVKPKA
jgi:preprotein translocase subunit YajC